MGAKGHSLYSSRYEGADNPQPHWFRSGRPIKGKKVIAEVQVGLDGPAQFALYFSGFTWVFAESGNPLPEPMSVIRWRYQTDESGGDCDE